MLTKPEPETRVGIRNYLIIMWVLVGIVVLFVAGLFLSRWDENNQMKRRAAAQERADAKEAFELMGGNRFEILAFYAVPGVVRRGGEIQLCYGVSNAKSVRIEPLTKSIRPALMECFAATPTKTTTYTLTAEDSLGHIKTSSITVQVP
jgi:hypothetical protein